jgi:citrate synthase
MSTVYFKKIKKKVQKELTFLCYNCGNNLFQLKMSKKQAKFVLPDGSEYQFDVIDGTIGPSAIDMRKLYDQTGFFTYDPGFMSTASCSSKITFIDGDKGQLMHRGYNIVDLASGKFDYLEIAYLLLYGNLPNKDEFQKFKNDINLHTLLHERVYEILNGFMCKAHPMAVIIGLLSSLSAFYHEADFSDKDSIEITSHRMIAKIITIVAAVYKHTVGQKIIYPTNSLDYTSNFLKMMFAVESEDYVVNQTFRDALNIIFILHADHEQNASTSTVRLAGSSGANPFACIAAGVASLWGPLHGGANEAVINMLEEIGSVKNIQSFIEKVKNKVESTKLMGFGHRVYKNFDPRANILREQSKKVLALLGGRDDKLLDIAQELERIALQDSYFIERKLYPNVDFYSGIILKAIGIPTAMFTPIFALARVSGWIAQWKEMIEEKGKIGRPRQIYTGKKSRNTPVLD